MGYWGWVVVVDVSIFFSIKSPGRNPSRFFQNWLSIKIVDQNCAFYFLGKVVEKMFKLPWAKLFQDHTAMSHHHHQGRFLQFHPFQVEIVIVIEFCGKDTSCLLAYRLSQNRKGGRRNRPKVAYNGLKKPLGCLGGHKL